MAEHPLAAELRRHVRTVPDWPVPGVQFRDITPLLADGTALRQLIEALAQRYESQKPDAIVGLEARGFIIGSALACRLGCGFVPIRKKGKLPFECIEESYVLEYGSATVEAHVDALKPGQRVVLVDDLIASGGTMTAGARLVQRLGAELLECAAVIDLPQLRGSQQLREAGHAVFSLLEFQLSDA
ncbi:adenine phosphoribosyltransferase [Pelomonas sp. SE-A7]|uniref:adenine phosphoribosyltransferase n=1 Tax=Pelomonas sp. SE-A7 TaxID=3054953 RepID=UPI00259C8EC5|nr:adenine phosphoribosyltransferase [Pelomonas sp. SE-A7]MDM4768447.1 adenine phosphoribosyltransferase [Pelomonas sp. SE-A7]